MTTRGDYISSMGVVTSIRVCASSGLSWSCIRLALLLLLTGLVLALATDTDKGMRLLGLGSASMTTSVLS